VEGAISWSRREAPRRRTERGMGVYEVNSAVREARNSEHDIQLGVSTDEPGDGICAFGPEMGQYGWHY